MLFVATFNLSEEEMMIVKYVLPPPTTTPDVGRLSLSRFFHLNVHVFLNSDL